jgi:hypothetical protein
MSEVKPRKRSSSLTQRLKNMRRTSSGSQSQSRGESPCVSESDEERPERPENKRSRSRPRLNTNDKEVELHELQERVRMLESQQAMHEFQGLAAPVHGTVSDTYASGSQYVLVGGASGKLGEEEQAVTKEYGWLRRCCFYCCWST